MAGSLEGKVVLVAGVGEGMGTAVVCLLASEGATVVGVARHAPTLEAIAAHGRPLGWKVESHTADVSDLKQAERLVERIVEQHGGLDALSLNAGRWIPRETLLHRMAPEDWTDAIRGNLDPIYHLGRVVLPPMIDRHRGSVVMVAAARPVRWAGSAAYCAAKGGVIDLVPKLARDYRATGVRFNAVLPGSIEHETGGFDPPAPDAPAALRDQTKTSPWQIARAIRYLVSDESRWVTGALLTVDGGATTGGAEPPSNP
jgi:NAD(P)-dependent dehydrogenase (short-subunit alcohol dehydrogenase family)